MPCTEAYREHIMYTFNGYCKTVIRFAAINAWRDRSRRRQKEISLEYLTEEKFYPLGTTDEYFEAPYEEYPVAGIRSAVSEAMAGFAGQAGDIIIPVYVGGTLLDEVIVGAQERQSLRSGGR